MILSQKTSKKIDMRFECDEIHFIFFSSKLRLVYFSFDEVFVLSCLIFCDN